MQNAYHRVRFMAKKVCRDGECRGPTIHAASALSSIFADGSRRSPAQCGSVTSRQSATECDTQLQPIMPKFMAKKTQTVN
jgi:hypothetical protein